ncbi:MAG: hypothetical protein KBS74_03505 [Clostridiales bacterium]|nr:hypothetical protein [Candidatus Cacconaster stercorequi]
MKRIFALALALTLLGSLCACTQQATQPMEPEHFAPAENAAKIHYVWNRVNMELPLPEGWCWESDEHNQFGQSDWNDDLPDAVGFDFWPEADPEVRFSFRCWTHVFAMCGTGVDFAQVSGLHDLTVATEPADNGKSVMVTILFHQAPGDYVVSGQISTMLWEKYRNAVLGMIDEATLGEGCMTYGEAVELARAALPEMTDEPEVGSYDVLTGRWRIVWRDGAEVEIAEDGTTKGLDGAAKR